MTKDTEVTIVLGGEKYHCILQHSEYLNGRIALELTDANEPWETVCVATVNIPDAYMQVWEVAIKSYSENEGLYEQLRDQRIISEAKRWVSTGWVTVPICDILV